MTSFTAIIKKFTTQGDKSGWTYIEIPEAIALQLVPGNKKAFRVKGKLDQYVYFGISLVPMGGGHFIMALNAAVRKCIGKGKGALLHVQMEVDKNPVVISPELIECLADEPAAFAYFKELPGSHQKYFSRWIESAKTEMTKAKRIAQTIAACAQKQSFGEMIRAASEGKEQESKKSGYL